MMARRFTTENTEKNRIHRKGAKDAKGRKEEKTHHRDTQNKKMNTIFVYFPLSAPAQRARPRTSRRPAMP
jgi:hypothetical protein